MPPTTILEIRDLERSAEPDGKSLLRVDGVAIIAGDRIAIRGPTGSGKTTFLRAVAMLDPYDVGSLRFHGVQPTGDAIPGFRRSVIYLPQRPAVSPGTVREALQLPFQFDQGDAEFCETSVLRLLEPFDKTRDFLDSPTDTLSGGERQIVSLVRAIQLNPQVLLLDEPTASLDGDAAARVERVIRDWHSDIQPGMPGRAFVLASHDRDQVARMTQRVLWIDDGVVGQEPVDV